MGPFVGYAILGFMLTNLKLKGNKLLIYAIIFNLSNGGNQEFHGTQKDLSNWSGADRRTVTNTLRSLVDEGLLIKSEEYKNNIRFVSYRVAPIHLGEER